MTEVSKRYRVNISTSVKGIKTYDCTVDITRSMNEVEGGDFVNSTLRKEILDESDKLVAELDKKYPPTIETKEVK